MFSLEIRKEMMSMLVKAGLYAWGESRTCLGQEMLWTAVKWQLVAALRPQLWIIAKTWTDFPNL